MTRTFALCFGLWAASAPLLAEDAVTPGRLTVEPPTLICLGFEWEIAGDDNRNAAVAVHYRKTGATNWRQAQPLLRIGGERVFRLRESLDYTTPHMFAGSILDLEPDTAYQCRLTMSDPDGVRGQPVQTVTLRTRGVPRPYPAGRTLHVYPPSWKGPKQEPAFTGLKAAYYGSGLGDWDVVAERTVLPGDTILVHAGRYRADRLNYVDPLGIPFHGAYVLTAKGTPARPITIRAAGDGEVIFDGAGAYRLFDVMAADYHIFEGLTIRNTDIAFLAGWKGVTGAKGLAVIGCRMENVGIGVTTQWAGSRDFYIADNVILGRDDPHRLIGWWDPGIYGATPLDSYYAVKVYGAGHVICHNRVAWFHDGISVCTHGSPSPHERAVAIDIYNNDIHHVADDFIEADGGVHNIRILRNRGVNAAQTGLSGQPVFGGPAYYVRNLLYHIPNGVAFKFKAKPAGLLVYHNTVIAESRNAEVYSNAHFRNNLILGNGRPGWEVFIFPNATSYSTYDYNGYRPNPGAPPYLWFAPAGAAPAYPDRPEFQRFTSLKQLAQATRQEAHGVELDYDVFAALTPPDPDKPHAIYHARNLDFRLRPGSKAVDAGVILPNINDHFTGHAPDLGALELGRPLPVYGPRTQTRPEN